MHDPGPHGAEPCPHTHDPEYFTLFETFKDVDRNIHIVFECGLCHETSTHVEAAEPTCASSPDILQHARNLITLEDDWIHTDYAHDRHGRHATPEADNAVAWSLVGAIRRAVAKLAAPSRQRFLKAAVFEKLVAIAKADFPSAYRRIEASSPDEPDQLVVAHLNDAGFERHEDLIEWCEHTIVALRG